MKAFPKNRICDFFTLLFCLFILASLVLIVTEKPIINRFEQGKVSIQWPIFLLSILITANILFGLSFLMNRSSFKIKQSVMLVVLLVITAVPRYLWIHWVNVIPEGDFDFYHYLASELVKGNRTLENYYISLFPHVLGYPAVLSLFYKTFGASIFVAQMVNILFSCGIVIVLYQLGKSLANWKCGFVAGLLWAVWPSQIFYTALVASEMLYTFLLFILILLFRCMLKSKKSLGGTISAYSLLGIYCALVNAVRPFGLVLVIAIIVYYFLFTKESFTPHSIIAGKAILLTLFLVSYFVCTTLITTTITAKNNIKTAVSPVGFNLYVGSNAKYSGAWNEEDAKVLLQIQDKPGITSQEVHNRLFAMGIERFKSQGTENIKLFKEKFKTMWAEDYDILWYIKMGLNPEVPPRFDLDGKYNWLAILCNFYYYLILLLCAFYSLLLFKNRGNDFDLFIMLLIFGMISVHLLVEVHGRYHYAAMPLLALLASNGMYTFSGLITYKNKKQNQMC